MIIKVDYIIIIKERRKTPAFRRGAGAEGANLDSI